MLDFRLLSMVSSLAVLRFSGTDLDVAGESGERTIPRPCFAPSGMSSSSSDTVDDAVCSVVGLEDEGVHESAVTDELAERGEQAARGEDPDDERAAKIDCDTSENKPDARRWLLVYLHHKLRQYSH